MVQTTDSLQEHYSELAQDLAELEWASENLEEWANDVDENHIEVVGPRRPKVAAEWEKDLEREALALWEQEHGANENSDAAGPLSIKPKPPPAPQESESKNSGRTKRRAGAGAGAGDGGQVLSRRGGSRAPAPSPPHK